jgi:hypothetical protein
MPHDESFGRPQKGLGVDIPVAILSRAEQVMNEAKWSFGLSGQIALVTGVTGGRFADLTNRTGGSTPNSTMRPHLLSYNHCKGQEC